MPEPLELNSDVDSAVIQQLRDVLGNFFADKLMEDAVWARGVLSGSSDLLCTFFCSSFSRDGRCTTRCIFCCFALLICFAFKSYT